MSIQHNEEMLNTITDINHRNYQRKVLFVEDSDVNRLLGNRYLLKLGLEVVSAENGQQAIDALKKERFHLILMDLEMPILGGIAATEIIRKQGLSKAPIIALTGHEGSEIRLLCKKSKMNGYMIKPITIEKLIFELDKYFT